jgi:hypothetical protein
MSRQLDSEKPFLILTNLESHPIIDAYRIMNAVIRPFDSDQDRSPFGTIICLSTEDVFEPIAKSCECRFFGILPFHDGFIIRQKKEYVPSAKAEGAYIGIPTLHEKEDYPPEFWAITYPHITLVPPNHKIHLSADKLQQFDYFYSEFELTENTYVHHVLMESGPHHITRAVRNGMKPVIAGKEVSPGKMYTKCIGHSVIM